MNWVAAFPDLSPVGAHSICSRLQIAEFDASVEREVIREI